MIFCVSAGLGSASPGLLLTARAPAGGTEITGAGFPSGGLAVGGRSTTGAAPDCRALGGTPLEGDAAALLLTGGGAPEEGDEEGVEEGAAASGSCPLVTGASAGGAGDGLGAPEEEPAAVPEPFVVRAALAFFNASITVSSAPSS